MVSRVYIVPDSRSILHSVKTSGTQAETPRHLLHPVEEIVFSAQDKLFGTAHRRLENDRWQTDLLRTPGAELRLVSLGMAQR